MSDFKSPVTKVKRGGHGWINCNLATRPFEVEAVKICNPNLRRFRAIVCQDVHLCSFGFTMFYYVSLCFRFTWAKQRLSPILPPVAPSFGPLDGTMEVHLADALPLAVPRSATERSGDWVDDMAMGLLAVCHHYRTLPV